MDIEKVVEKINKDRYRVEACFVFSCWNDPELYEEYMNINEGKDRTLIDKDARFYWALGKNMYKQGVRAFDPITVDTYLNDKEQAKKIFDEYGGYKEVKELMDSINSENVESYFDDIIKRNNLITIATKYDELFEDVNRFKNASSEDVYNTFDLLNNTVSLTTKEKIEDLVITDKDIEGLKNGEDMGFNYGKYSPLLNYITLGAAPGMYMVAGQSGQGKSSFAFENMLMGLHENGLGTAVVSNEMGIKVYKILLLSHILTNDLNYWGLTRKQIRIGKWTEEQNEMILKAKEISKEKYSNIKFIRMETNNIKKINKFFRKLKSMGISIVLYDTFKSDDETEVGLMWQSLLMDSRKIDQTCRKLNICCITTYQLAPAYINQRYLDVACLSNAKQIKEVYETMIYMRPVWEDELDGGKYDIHPYKFNRNNKKVKEKIVLKKDKKYLLVFVDKTRSDEDKQILVYEWKAHFNCWKELGFAKVINDHRNA